MKYIKFIALLAISAVSLNLSAAVTAKATLTIKADGQTFNDKITLTQDDAAAADYSDANIGVKVLGTSPVSVNVWAEYNSTKYACAIVPDLEGTMVKFQANQYNTAYTISFSNVDGETLFLQKGTDLIPMTEDYSFTCAANEVVTFSIAKAHVYTRTVSNVWGTICLPQSVDAANITNATIYSVASKTETNLYLEEVTTGMVAGTPYIFKADAVGDVKFAYNNDAVSVPVAATGLVGTFVDTYIGVEDMYVISNNVVRLATATSTVKANRAYINLSGVAPYASAPGRKLVPVRIANATTDIENAAEAAEIEKQIVNGQLLIRKAGVLYNVQGQIVK